MKWPALARSGEDPYRATGPAAKQLLLAAGTKKKNLDKKRERAAHEFVVDCVLFNSEASWRWEPGVLDRLAAADPAAKQVLVDAANKKKTEKT